MDEHTLYLDDQLSVHLTEVGLEGMDRMIVLPIKPLTRTFRVGGALAGPTNRDALASAAHTITCLHIFERVCRMKLFPPLQPIPRR